MANHFLTDLTYIGITYYITSFAAGPDDAWGVSSEDGNTGFSLFFNNNNQTSSMYCGVQITDGFDQDTYEQNLSNLVDAFLTSLASFLDVTLASLQSQVNIVRVWQVSALNSASTTMYGSIDQSDTMTYPFS